MVLALRSTSINRHGRTQIKFNANGWPTVQEPREEKLTRADITIGGESISIFVPLYGPHPVTSKKNDSFENTSTLLSVDANHDENLDRHEAWWTSMPVRLGDQMFAVKSIDPGSKWILLSKSSAPLAGVIVGKPCPDFKFTTTDGKTVTLADYRGKALLLDIWSKT
jgi:hypothetical protein